MRLRALLPAVTTIVVAVMRLAPLGGDADMLLLAALVGAASLATSAVLVIAVGVSTLTALCGHARRPRLPSVAAPLERLLRRTDPDGAGSIRPRAPSTVPATA